MPQDRTKGRWRRFRRDSDKGQTLVEFALVLPVFLMLMFGLVDFGRGFYSWQLITNAAREGARVAAVQGDSTAIDNRVYGSFCSAWPTPSSCGLDSTQVSIAKSNVQGARGSEVSVTVTYNFAYVTPIGPLVALFGGSSFSAPVITSTTKMRLE